MKDLLTYLEELWTQAGYPGVAAVLAGLAAVTSLVTKFGASLWKAHQERKLQQNLFPFYKPHEIQEATQYYVETQCQQIAPNRADEPGESHAFGPRDSILRFFLKQAFHPASHTAQYYIVLADSGMGKTTFTINLYLRYVKQFQGAHYQIKLLPLAWPDIDKEIEAIKENREHTILLLDAFDEDPKALHNYETRLHELIEKTNKFRKVIITCRTQFFPSEVEEPKETGMMLVGGEGGAQTFYKLYLSPFDDDDIETYLQKRFAWHQKAKKDKARQLVQQCPNLMVRPMLLSHIEELMHGDIQYRASFMVYAELIRVWAEREAKKFRDPDKRTRYQQDVLDFSRKVAIDIYEQREQRQGALTIPKDDIQEFAKTHQVNLNALEMESKSLLNRNALSQYKFSHKSILEYFLAEEAFWNADFRRGFDVEGMDQTRSFLVEMSREKLTLPFLLKAQGQYCISEGFYHELTTLNEKTLPELLPQITGIRLSDWNECDDVLLFTALPALQLLELSGESIDEQQLAGLKQELPGCKVRRRLRSRQVTVSKDEFRTVFGLDENRRPLTYIQNEYEQRDEVVLDHATGLTWQQSGSEQLLYNDALKYVKRLNRQKFAGYQDWRLPTIPELMSLLEPEEQSNGLYINPIFPMPKDYPWYWSADTVAGSSESAWLVHFHLGLVDWYSFQDNCDVRCVRS